MGAFMDVVTHGLLQRSFPQASGDSRAALVVFKFGGARVSNPPQPEGENGARPFLRPRLEHVAAG
jgi:hypothetical protein